MHTQRPVAPSPRPIDRRPIDRRPIDRRTVVRTGAWSVPVLSLAVAAPALAASAVKGKLNFDTFNVFGADYNNKGKPASAQSQIQAQNQFTAGGPTLATVTVLVTYPGSRVDGAAAQAVTGTGWSFGSATASGSSWVYSFVWTGSLATSQSTSTLSYKVPLRNSSSGNIALTALASGTNVDPATATATTNL
jgi:hypothetical protein